jgi:hypothetical protein
MHRRFGQRSRIMNGTAGLQRGRFSVSTPARAAAGTASEFAHARVPLRHYRLFARAPYVDVSSSQITLHLPSIFGAKHNLVVPIREVAVFDPTMSVAPPDGSRLVYLTPIRLPYLATTTPNVKPNVALFFNMPRRIPPLRRLGAINSSLSRGASRSTGGLLVDGIYLRAVVARDAIDTIAGAGAARVGDADAWLIEHRETSRHPAVVAQAKSIARRKTASLVLRLAGLALLVGASRLLDSTPRWWVHLIAAVGAVAGLGIPAILSRRNKAAIRRMSATAIRRSR